MKKYTSVICVILFSFYTASAQIATVLGTVVDKSTNELIRDVEIEFISSIYNTTTNAEGMFKMSDEYMPLGEQVLSVSKNGYVSQLIRITIYKGETLNMGKIFFAFDFSTAEEQIGVISLSDNELDEDEGSSFSVAGFLQASKDVFLTAAAYDFSATFFRPRGYNSENGKVLINGIEMNKIYDGRPQWGNWGGLNDAQRNQSFSMGLKANDYTFSDLAGTTNIIMRASQYRQGGRISYASSNRTYKGRVMGSYNSGLLANGWAYSVLLSRRYANEGFKEGTLYDANAFFVAIENQINSKHSLNLAGFYTPNRRGKSSPNTQEVIDLKGINYNSYWGRQDGEIRNSRIKEVKEPVVMVNHFWNVSDKISLNTNVGYQFGSLSNSRLGYDNAPNPDPSYYQKLPSFFLSNPNGADLGGAYSSLTHFVEKGQINWQDIYETNVLFGGTSRYYLYEDKVDDKQLSVNTIVYSVINDHIKINASLNYKKLRSNNYANMIDLLGGYGYLDVDTFNQGDAAQNDLNNPNRIIDRDDTFKYNYTINATKYTGFLQGQFTYKRTDFYLAGNIGKINYQRNGHYKNGSFPDNSFGIGEELNFNTFGAKAGIAYKITGRHALDFNTAYFADAPNIRNSFSNSRQNNDVVDGITEQKNINFDSSYLYRSSLIKIRLTGYYTKTSDESEIGFYYADGISSTNRNVRNAFVQEVLNGIEKKYIGSEFGVEVKITPTIKLKGAGAYGQYTYANNPLLYLTSDDVIGNGENPKRLDLGKAYIKNYKISGGPQQAYQIGFEYRDPDFWWFGTTTNYFSHAYTDIAPITRTQNLYLDNDQIPFNEYDPEIAKGLLEQEKFDNYFLVNIIGGKSWKVKDYYIGFFATINNVLDKEYKTGGFEQARSANYRELVADKSNPKPVFGSKYFYGNGATYYLNVYVRF